MAKSARRVAINCSFRSFLLFAHEIEDGKSAGSFSVTVRMLFATARMIRTRDRRS